jgi:dynein heavy chain
MEFFGEWCNRGLPFVYNMSAFTYPQGFTTALLQRFSRKSFGANIISIDKLEFDFIITNRPVLDIQEYPKDGGYVTGLVLEGAKWHEEKGYLCEPEVMELEVPMPVIHFKPIQRRKKLDSLYSCPVYYYPIRSGTVSRDSYIMSIELKSGE